MYTIGNTFRKHSLIIFVMIVAIVLRFYGLSERGMIEWDSAYYANHATYYVYGLEMVRTYGLKEAVGKLKEKILGVETVASRADVKGKNTGDALSKREAREVRYDALKPGHIWLLVGSFLMFGIHDYVVLGFSALCGVLSVLLIFLIGRKFLDVTVGLIGASWFAIYGINVAFSRMGYPQADTVLLLLVTTYVYLTSLERRDTNWKYLIAIGFFCGYGMLMHMSFLTGLASLILTELFCTIWLRRFSATELSARLGWMGVGFILPIVLAEVVYNFGGGSFIEANLSYVMRGAFPIGRYAEVLGEGARAAGPLSGMVGNVVFVVKMLLLLEIPLVWIGAVGGVLLGGFLSVRHGSPILFFLVVQSVMPYAYSVLVYPTLKAVHIAFGALALLGGLFYSSVISRVVSSITLRQSHQWLVSSLVTACLIWGSWHVLPWVRYRTGYQEAVRQLVQVLGERGGVFSVKQGSLRPLLRFYLRQESEKSSGVRGRVNFRSEQTDYVMIDYRAFIKKQKHEQKVAAAREGSKVFEVHNLDEFLPIFHYHRRIPSDDVTSVSELKLLPSLYRDSKYVALFDLRNERRAKQRSESSAWGRQKAASRRSGGRK